jgi:hypothetical protein
MASQTLQPQPELASWQSVYWALVTIAFNSILEDSGKACGLPSRYDWALYSSPIICAADASLMIVEIVDLWLRHEAPLPIVTRCVWLSRLEDSSENQSSNPGLPWWIRFVAFVVGALPQATKMMGIHGIPFSQM